MNGFSRYLVRWGLSPCLPRLLVWCCLTRSHCLSISAVCTALSPHTCCLILSFFLSILYLPDPFFFSILHLYYLCISKFPLLPSILFGLYLLCDHVILLELWHLFPSMFRIYPGCPLSGSGQRWWAHLVVSVLAPGDHYSMRSYTVYWTLLYSVWPKTSTHRWGWCDCWWPSIWRPRPRRADSSTGDHTWQYCESPYY